MSRPGAEVWLDGLSIGKAPLEAERAVSIGSHTISARGPDFTWDWGHRPPGARGSFGGQTTPNTAVDLATVMRTNPHLKVLFLNGYYDLATPFYGTEFDVSHMLLEPELQRNVAFEYYPSGHMIYMHPEMLSRMRDDLAAWYRAALTGV